MKLKEAQVVITIFITVLSFTSCSNSIKSTSEQGSPSEWRDHSEVDSASYYKASESCNEILGKLKIKSRLHKNLMEPGVFGGGMSSRWLEIKKDSIIYFSPNGEVADRGICVCENGVLTVEWQVRYDRTMAYHIHFNTSDFVELRYYDYPFSFDTFEYDTTKTPTNPTKLIGIVEPFE